MNLLIVLLLLLYAAMLIYSGLQIRNGNDMISKVSKNPMCCGPVIDKEAANLCMAPSQYECVCGKCENWYSCDNHLTDMTLVHFLEFKTDAKWQPVNTEKHNAKTPKNI